MADLYYRIIQRRDTAENWTTENPTLEAGEWGYETDTKKIKLGDGTTAWNNLSYFAGGSAVVAWDDVTGKPTFATVATTGSYNDLTNKPTIGDGSIKISQGGEVKGTFTLNQEGDLSIELDAGSIAEQVQSDWAETDTTSKAYIENKPTTEEWAFTLEDGTTVNKKVYLG